MEHWASGAQGDNTAREEQSPSSVQRVNELKAASALGIARRRAERNVARRLQPSFSFLSVLHIYFVLGKLIGLFTLESGLRTCRGGCVYTILREGQSRCTTPSDC